MRRVVYTGQQVLHSPWFDRSQILPFPTCRLISRFASRDDLIEALLTSCHLPYWFNFKLATVYQVSKAQHRTTLKTYKHAIKVVKADLPRAHPA